MKRMRFMAMLLSVLSLAFMLPSCDDDDDDDTPDEGGKTTETDGNTPASERTWSEDGGLKAADNLLFEGNVIGNGDQEFVFKGKQSLPKGTYTLKGWVYIGEGSELTLAAGTVIKGDKQTKAALIVERGGKLVAQGTKEAPIVLTSAQPAGQRKPGDWGGLILCGKAKNNQQEMQIEGGPRTKHGGSDDADNSGIVSYVRVEFAGYPFATDKEINGITFGSVGSGTQVDHLQVSYSNDDSFEWFGGAVNCKYLVAYHGWDDEFDTDNGFSGRVQFALGVRDPHIADASQSNGFESDNCADGANVQPYTSCVFSNVTLIGPKGQDAAFKNDDTYINGGAFFPNNGSGLGKFQAAMHLRRGTRLQCYNSLGVGYPIGVIVDGEKGDSQTQATAGTLALNRVWLAGYDIVASDANKVYKDELYNYTDKTTDGSKKSFSDGWFLTAAYKNQAVEDATTLGLTKPNEKVGAPYAVGAGTEAATAADFTAAAVAQGFEKVQYLGAVGPTDTWLDGWTEFDPQNAAY